MKKGYCECCLKEVDVRDEYEDDKHLVICSVACTIAISLFNLYYSDKEINMREHYEFQPKLGEGK